MQHNPRKYVVFTLIDPFPKISKNLKGFTVKTAVLFPVYEIIRQFPHKILARI
jgi:hypothetical protein